MEIFTGIIKEIYVQISSYEELCFEVEKIFLTNIKTRTSKYEDLIINLESVKNENVRILTNKQNDEAEKQRLKIQQLKEVNAVAFVIFQYKKSFGSIDKHIEECFKSAAEINKDLGHTWQ
jgi:hypothetical protein